MATATGVGIPKELYDRTADIDDPSTIEEVMQQSKLRDDVMAVFCALKEATNDPECAGVLAMFNDSGDLELSLVTNGDEDSPDEPEDQWW